MTNTAFCRPDINRLRRASSVRLGGLIFVCLLLVFASTVPAADYYVMPTNSASAEPYTDWTIAGTNIIDVVNAAMTNSGTRTVWVTNGAYLVTNQILMTNIITVMSFNGYSNTLVYADFPNYTTRVFSVANTGIVDGFTISNGHWYEGISGGGGYGGGAYINNALVRNCYFVNNLCSNSTASTGGGGAYVTGGGIISNCVIYANIARQIGSANMIGGGGILLYNGKALKCIVVSNTTGSYGGGINALGADIISNCVISYNVGSQGVLMNNTGLCIDSIISNNFGGAGAGFQVQGANCRVFNCTIINNISSGGGGGGYFYGNGFVSNCVIVGNRAAGSDSSSGVGGGGGLAMYGGGTVKIISCSISNNLSNGGKGGGGIVTSSKASIINCLIANNTNTLSGAYGGGVCISNSSENTNNIGVINCTIVNNYSTTDGGGLAATGVSNYIANCIIVSNSSTAGIYPNVYNTGANSNNYWYCCANPTSAPLAPNHWNITNDPLFVDSANRNWRLKTSSPCVNAGTNQGWMTNSYDLDGKVRIRYGLVDMGAYERIYDGSIYTVH